MKRCLFRKRCFLNAQWYGSSLRCSKCNEPVAVRYKVGSDTHVFTFERFKQYEQAIAESATLGNTMASAIDGEWEDFLRNIRQPAAEVQSVSKDGERCEEDSDIEQSIEIGGENE